MQIYRHKHIGDDQSEHVKYGEGQETFERKSICGQCMTDPPIYHPRGVAYKFDTPKVYTFRSVCIATLKALRN